GALQWVQNEIRYFGVSLGESSHRPYPPNEVAKRRFGDCKDKAYLLVTLLRELGIEARPVLVALSSRKMPAKVLPSPNMFDHVIVEAKIDGKSWYLDGTRLGQRGKLSQMGLGLEDAVGLVVAPDTRDLQVLHSPNVRELSTVEASDHFTLARLDGDGELQATVIWHGVNAENVRMVASQLTPEQMRRFALANYEVRYPGITLTGQPELSDDPENNRISLTAHYKVPKLAQESGGAWVMKFFPYNLRAIFNVPPQLSRNFPLAITTYPYVARYKLVMDWPDNVAMVLDPSTQRLDNDYFKLDIARSFRGNHATLDLLLETRTDELAPARLPRFMEELQKFNVALGGYIAIDRGALKKDGFLGFGRNTLQDNIRKRLQSTIDRTTRTIAAGRLSGEDLAGAYCDRAEALADIGKADEGMKDAQEAVRLAPEFSRAWECRGNLYFDNGDFAKAIPDLNKALGLGADEFSSFYRRGHARFYLGKLPEAAEDFAKAARQSKDGEGALYAELWQLWTLQRLKRSIPPELQAHATENPHGAWPRPALAMLAGVLTPEQMLDEVSRQKGDERELNEAEAYFYLGQHRLNQGQPQQAKEAFEKTRAKGITMYLEHVAAGFELGRLQGK
ncbi:MAG: tetratricopeptide repeat protein, partial [Zoogloea sp.]|nr:tetratricopeptide repeat protein [Zoogloea sp.]